MRPTHLDDELLSAHLDGEAPEAGAHLAACAECRARYDALAAAAALVGAPPPPPPAPDAVDAAVARALGSGSRAPNRRPMLAALAAAVVAVLGIVGVGVVDGGGRDDDDTAALVDRDEVAGGGGATGSLSVTDGGDLGEPADAKALADVVRAAVEPPPTSTSGPDGAHGEAAASEAVGAPVRRSVSRLQSGDGKAGTQDPYCEETVRKTYAEGLGVLVYRATLRWEGTPAVVVAYTLEEPQGELDHRVYVLAVSDCRLLVAQTV